MDIKGIFQEQKLPFADFDNLWDRIIVPVEIKETLIAQILLEFTVRSKFSFSEVPLHGLILLIGPPGTGKTSLAKGAASKAAGLLKGGKINYLEVDPHELTSSALGKSQREVRNLLNGVIVEKASQGPLIVLLDEVETLAANRSKMSLEANPIDVHRATDAVLAGLDNLAQSHSNVLFIATSNFEKAIDGAFISRADLIEKIERPTKEAREAIINDVINIMSKEWPKLKDLIKKEDYKTLAKVTEGLDGRQIRKACLQACTFDKEVALNPNLLTLEHIIKAFEKSKAYGL